MIYERKVNAYFFPDVPLVEWVTVTARPKKSGLFRGYLDSTDREDFEQS